MSGHWRTIRDRERGEVYRDVGIEDDGTLFNPHHYPEDLVRAAVQRAEARLHDRRSAAAKKAAETRRLRKERLVYETVQRLQAGGVLTPGINCEICGRGLTDRQSKARGIGSDCWQLIMAHLTRTPTE
jgi:hypothetical protein